MSYFKNTLLASLSFLGLTGLAWAEPPVQPEPQAASEAAEAPPVNQSGPYPRGTFSGTTQGVFNTGDDEGFGLGPVLPDPSAFDGSNRPEIVLDGSRYNDNLNLTAHYGHYLTPTQRLMLTGQVGTTNFSTDLDYSFIPEGMDGYFSTYVNYTRSQHVAFRPSGFLSNAQQPWVARACAGFGYTTDPSQRFILSSALIYENISLYNGALGGRIPGLDRRGRALTVAPGGVDNTLALRLVGTYLGLDDLQFPTSGDKFNFSLEQDIPIGATQVDMTRFNFNFSHFQRLGDPTLILNLECGFTRGRVAPYEAYNLGGFNSVRGFQLGELGAGTRFLQLSSELRVPLGKVELFGSEIPMRFTTFVDYGSALGSTNKIFGQSQVVRRLPDSGLGYGVGLQAVTDFGLVRLESAFASRGRSQFSLSIGDRY
ncbi:BamA/TamA family outer membrane protein [bacterium]|nr:BamA/TamA family outer membrane protein [bacterium]